MLRRALLLLMMALPALAQKLPEGVILIKGAEPSASDTKTPLPERGAVAGRIYRNDYFGLTWTLPAGWTQQNEGPPPSDHGNYVLAQFGQEGHGTLLITAQDLFFALTPPRNAIELVKYSKDNLQPYYTVEREPSEVRIGGRAFGRFEYGSAAAQLHWAVLATRVRCHLLQFMITTRDPKLLASLISDLDGMKIADADAPQCAADYAALSHVEPRLYDHRFNPIPARVIVGKDGKVKHVHVISAFPDQARNITEAVMQWQFKPAETEMETGMWFGAKPGAQ
ncbi:MAG TPA: hypothetical protein VGR02_00445 [Thermoanaerobaculia bacterium]|jgi:hypothetical protein|nr:hypothetical protein [Thermoanaerobaculia bacterium]